MYSEHWSHYRMYITVGSLYKGHFGTLISVLITEVVLKSEVISYTTVLHGTQNCVLIIEVVLKSEVMSYTTVLHWDTEWCPYYRGFCNSEVCNIEVPL